MSNIIDKVEDGVKKWLLSKGLAKGAVSLAKLIVSYAAAHGIKFVGNIGGIDIDLSNVLVMTAAINAGLATLRNMLKVKYPRYFGWM